MTVNNWQQAQDIKAYKIEIHLLKERIDGLKEIEEQHRILNGQLREEINYLRKQLKEQ